MKFHVGARDLEAALNRHGSTGTATAGTDSHLLLLVYAVECGLKLLVLRRRGLHSTSRLEDDDLTHNLDALLQRLGSRLRLGPSTVDPNQVNIESGEIHQVLRYGGRFSSERRQELFSRTKEVLAWIRESL
jgi:hypothetical protein